MTHIRFIHAADLHIGSPFAAAAGASAYVRKQLENSTYTAIDRLVQDAIVRKVDFIILAGDLFDQENRGIRSQLFLKKKMSELQLHDISVYIIFGNHDPINAVYAPTAWPDNVHFFSSTPECKRFMKNNQPAAHLYGCSYEQRAVYHNLAHMYKKQEGAPYHIAILHGQEKTMNDHLPYAPFSVRELKDKKMDYWALGHIHKRKSLSENIYYPGNIQGRHKKEAGAKGYLYVELSYNGAHVTFQPAGPVTFEKIELSISEHTTIDSLTDALLVEISRMQNKTSAGVIVEIDVYGIGYLSSYLEEENEREEWREALNQIGETERPFFYIQRIKNRSFLHLTGNDNDFLADIMNASLHLTQGELEDDWRKLLNHSNAKRFLSKESFNHNEIIEEAKQLVRRMWQKGGEG